MWQLAMVGLETVQYRDIYIRQCSGIPKVTQSRLLQRWQSRKWCQINTLLLQTLYRLFDGAVLQAFSNAIFRAVV